MKKLEFCIPSYKRPEKIQTLELFPDAVVFVAESEEEEYKKNNPSARIKTVPDKVQGNLCRIRNYILDVMAGNAIVILDDDISAIKHLTVRGERKTWEKVENEKLPGIFCQFAEITEEWGFDYFGLQCNSDIMVSRLITPFSTVSYIGGPVQGILPTNKCRYDERLYLKEDYDMTLQQCNVKRGCLRFNLYCYNAKQSKQKGGCASYRSIEEEKRQLELLRQKWGGKIVKIDNSNKGRSAKEKVIDYNPIIHIPIKGV